MFKSTWRQGPGESAKKASVTYFHRLKQSLSEVAKQMHRKEKTQKSPSSEASESNKSSETAENRRPESMKSTSGDLASVLLQLRRSMTRIYMCDDLSCPKCIDDLHYVYSQTCEYSEAVFQRLLELGILELIHEIWTRFFHKTVAEHKSGIVRVNAGASIESYSCAIVTNLTNGSAEVCRQLMQLSLHVKIIEFLKHDMFDANRLEGILFVYRRYFVDCLMKILCNIVQAIPESREYFRNQGIVQVLQRFLTNQYDSVSCLSMFLLAWVLNDEENMKIGSYQKLFNFLEMQLAEAMVRVNYHSPQGYKIIEILEIVNKLAVNDENRRDIIMSGILSGYATLLETTKDPKERLLAARGIWNLALSCPEEFKTSRKCVEILQTLLRATDEDFLRKQVSGTLTFIGFSPDPANNTRSGESSEPESRAKMTNVTLFIGYREASKDIVFQIRNRLDDNEASVWVDANGMFGPKGEDITTRICQPSVVLNCAKQKDYESPICRKGTEETGCSRMTENLTCEPESSAQDDEPITTTSAKVSHSTSASFGIFSWTKEDVKEWLKRNNFRHMKKWCEDYDGILLLGFKHTPERASLLITPNFVSTHSIEEFLSLNVVLQEL